MSRPRSVSKWEHRSVSIIEAGGPPRSQYCINELTNKKHLLVFPHDRRRLQLGLPKSSCASFPARVATATFDVLARRNSVSGAREVVVPYFATVTRAGTQLVSKQIGQVALRFEDGQQRAQTSTTATANIARAEAALPADIEERLNRKRKPGDADAAVDPMTEPAIRTAVSKASFELLLGFQLTNEQLAYNATR